MQSLIRSKSAGVAGGRGTAGAGPGRDLLYSAIGTVTNARYHRHNLYLGTGPNLAICKGMYRATMLLEMWSPPYAVSRPLWEQFVVRY